MKISEYLIESRKSLGYSQRDMSKRIGISYTQYNGLETKRVKNVSGSTLRKIGEFLNVSVMELRKMMEEE